MIRKIWIGFLGVFIFAGAYTQIIAAGQPGVTETIFNRRFIPTVKPQMTYDQIEKMAGASGAKVSEDKKAAPPMIQYRWKGGRNSVLTVRFRGNKMIDATVLVPNGRAYEIRSNGEVVEAAQ